MQSVEEILNVYGRISVKALQNDVQKISATGDTVNSIRYDIITKTDYISLRIIGRKFFKALETGRAPRKSNQESDFKDNILRYMQARGIGNDLDQKKKERLARFITLKINKEGDATYKKGGREVYSSTVTNIQEELTDKLKNFLVKDYTKKIIDGFKHT